MRQEFSACQYELNLSDKNCSQHSMTNGTGKKMTFLKKLSKSLLRCKVSDGTKPVIRCNWL